MYSCIYAVTTFIVDLKKLHFGGQKSSDVGKKTPRCLFTWRTETKWEWCTCVRVYRSLQTKNTTLKFVFSDMYLSDIERFLQDVPVVGNLVNSHPSGGKRINNLNKTALFIGL